MRRHCREVIYRAGDFADVDIYNVYNIGKGRKNRYQPTSELKQKINRRNSRAKASRIVHANFDDKSLVIHPTYESRTMPADDDQARRDERNFIRRLARRADKHGVPFKYFATGHRGEKSGRYNFHIIISGGVPVNEVIAAWGLGRCNVDFLQFNETGVADLVRYMGRDADELEDDEEEADLSIWKKRYICSQGLVDPEPEYNNKIARKVLEYIASQVYEAGLITAEGKQYIAERYPGYQCAEAFVSRSEALGGTYVRLRLFRPDSPLLAWRKKLSRAVVKRMLGEERGPA